MQASSQPEQRLQFTSLVLLIAGITVVFGALRFGAPVVSPILLAMVIALILWPVYVWLKRHGLGTLPALLVLVAGVIVCVGVVALIIVYSANGVASRVVLYSDRL